MSVTVSGRELDKSDRFDKKDTVCTAGNNKKTGL